MNKSNLTKNKQSTVAERLLSSAGHNEAGNEGSGVVAAMMAKFCTYIYCG